MSNNSNASTLRRVVVWALRLWIAWVFVSFAWGKLENPAEFGRSIFNYRMLPDAWISPMAVFLPWLEFWCGLALILCPPFRRSAWNLLLAMLLVFTVAKISALVRGLDISCGCSAASGGDSIVWMDVAFNILLLAGCLLGRVLDRRGWGVRSNCGK